MNGSWTSTSSTATNDFAFSGGRVFVYFQRATMPPPPPPVRRVSAYELLGVAQDAPIADIKRRYLALAKQHHPDAGGDPEVMKVINRAWDAIRAHRGIA